ncbi:glutaredoxin [Yoonia maricola]|uniref:Glutaredoxin n=1 Tax=Yoonia maricola TaxID=420999 RepID=A0A2M8W4X4_9RHOB|nr:glutaredoxin domain-containing protein [Yoonia maricola]PJI85983.1 glutaredoxin [Yoonia maricola]
MGALEIVLFTKPGCSHCARAKELLADHDMPFFERDILASDAIAAESIFRSGAVTVPQIFIGGQHVGGADALEALSKGGLLSDLVDHILGSLPSLPSDFPELSADEPLKTRLPESDGTHSDEPTEWPVLHMYKEFFGFWPNCFYFMHHWPEAYKLFIYCHNAISVGGGRDTLGGPGVGVVAWGSSNAHGCNYCKVHSVATMGEKSLGIPEALDKARAGDAGWLSPVKDFEVALADLAGHATLNTVSYADLSRVRDTAGHKGLIRHPDPDNVTDYVAMISGSFGFLNVYNDLTGVEVEPHWANDAKGIGLDAGRHGVKHDRAPTNLDHELPSGGPSMEDLQGEYRRHVKAAGGVDAFCRNELGIVPGWIARWPEVGQDLHAYFYAEMTQARTHSKLPSELRHLMAYVAAIEKGHDAVATDEAAMAIMASEDRARTVSRLNVAYSAAKSLEGGGDRSVDGFSDQERAALIFAWTSAQVPLETPKRFVAPVLKHFSEIEVIHLITTCAMASLVQRTAAVLQALPSSDAREMMAGHGLETSSLAIKARTRTSAI